MAWWGGTSGGEIAVGNVTVSIHFGYGHDAIYAILALGSGALRFSFNPFTRNRYISLKVKNSVTIENYVFASCFSYCIFAY